MIRWSDGAQNSKSSQIYASSWDIQNDGRVYILKLIPGVKWSDGAPFTADDVLFAVNDTLLDKEVAPSAPSWLAPGGDEPTVTKIDDFTIKFEYKIRMDSFWKIWPVPTEWLLSQDLNII